jgi:hypothetical protein
MCGRPKGRRKGGGDGGSTRSVGTVGGRGSRVVTAGACPAAVDMRSSLSCSGRTVTWRTPPNCVRGGTNLVHGTPRVDLARNDNSVCMWTEGISATWLCPHLEWPSQELEGRRGICRADLELPPDRPREHVERRPVCRIETKAPTSPSSDQARFSKRRPTSTRGGATQADRGGAMRGHLSSGIETVEEVFGIHFRRWPPSTGRARVEERVADCHWGVEYALLAP